MKLHDWTELLVDPVTKAPLIFNGEKITSQSGKDYFLIGNKPDFIGSEKRENFASQSDFLDRIKTILKNKFGKYYMFLIYVISPVYIRIHWPSLSVYLNHKVKEISKNKKYVIQIGSGNDRISEKVLNIDIFNYSEVDLIADCTKLPFADNSIDCVISNAVLEHVTAPDDFVAEAYRVLKPGGEIITGVPFIQGFHASPNDFYRWTDKGLEHLHGKFGFTKISIVPNSGPTSGFLWILQEWLSIILSFNINMLYSFWWFFFTIILMPLKFLDILFIHFKQAHKINSFYIYRGIKKAGKL
jgi:SAM-dependent methyltransferase